MAVENLDPSALIDRAMNRRGLAPMPGATPAPATTEAPAATAAAPSPEEVAAAKGAAAAAVASATSEAEADTAAKSEADSANDSPIKIMGKDGKEIELTPSQILGTLDRYKALNYRNMQMKPAMSVVEQLLAQAGEGDDAANKVADLLKEAVGAHLQGKVNGGTAAAADPDGDPNADPAANPEGEGDFDWSKWGEENEISVPKPFVQMAHRQKKVEDDIQVGIQAITQLANAVSLLHNHIVGGQATQQVDKRDMALHAVKTNLARLQQEFQFANEDEAPFYEFMMQRGYTPADLLDYDVAKTLGGDFKAVRATPEFQRLQEVAARRSAVAGSVEPGASGNPTGGAAKPSDDQQFFDRVLAKRGVR